MVFKRRDKPPILDRMRTLLYPRRGWGRALEYLSHRVRRLPDTPHRIALGFSCGVFISFTPFFGIHILLAMGLARLLRGNVIAGLIGTVAGNPVTFPVIASISLALGRRILGYGVTGRDFDRIAGAFMQAFLGLWESLRSLFGHGEAQWQKLTLFVTDILWPYLVGGFLPGLIAAIASYYFIRPLIVAYQAARRARLLPRAKGRLARRKSAADGTAAETYKNTKPGSEGGKT